MEICRLSRLAFCYLTWLWRTVTQPSSYMIVPYPDVLDRCAICCPDGIAALRHPGLPFYCCSITPCDQPSCYFNSGRGVSMSGTSSQLHSPKESRRRFCPRCDHGQIKWKIAIVGLFWTTVPLANQPCRLLQEASETLSRRPCFSILSVTNFWTFTSLSLSKPIYSTPLRWPSRVISVLMTEHAASQQGW